MIPDDEITYLFTQAPVDGETLQAYFEADHSLLVVEYEASQLRDEMFLRYVKNLDLNTSVYLYDQTQAESLCATYLHSELLVCLPEVLDMIGHFILARLGLGHGLMFDPGPFVEQNHEIIDLWIARLRAFLLYSFYCTDIEGIKEWVTTFPQEPRLDTMEGCNVVHLVNHDHFNDIMRQLDVGGAHYLPRWFNEPLLKGQPLLAYWVMNDNPWFRLPQMAIHDYLDIDYLRDELTAIAAQITEDTNVSLV